MIIDFHTHTYPDRIAEAALQKLTGNSHTRAFSDGTAACLSRQAKAAGIGLCVVLPVATSPRQVTHINDASILMNESTAQTGLCSLGAMHPDFEAPEAELRRLARAGIRGVKLHPPYQNVDFDDERYVRVLSACGELGLFVILHAGLDIGLPGAVQAVPEKIAAALEKAGPVRLICAHMGGWRLWERAARILAPLGVMIDTAFSLGPVTPAGDGYPWTDETLNMLDEDTFCRLVRLYGADRVLFGSDSPWADQQDQLRRLRALPLTDEEKETILSGNAARLMGWI